METFPSIFRRDLPYLMSMVWNSAWKAFLFLWVTTPLHPISRGRLSRMMMCCLCTVKSISGGKIPPLTEQPSKSAYSSTNSGLCFLKFSQMIARTESCLWVYLSSIFVQFDRMCPGVPVSLHPDMGHFRSTIFLTWLNCQVLSSC